VEVHLTGSRRSSEGLDERRRRLLFRAWHRGSRELDLLMGPFADAHIEHLSESELAAFEALTEVGDPELFAWIVGEELPPAAYDTPVLRRLRAFHGINE
jgi:antitoxin CptB